MRKMLQKMIRNVVITTLFLCLFEVASAVPIKGVVVDKETQSALIGATVAVEGTTTGTVTDLEGRFEMDLKKGSHVLVVSYISYVSQRIELDVTKADSELRVELLPDNQMLSTVTITAQKDLESEHNMQVERIASNVAIENMGAKEMTLKGLSSVQEGVKKMTGISVASSGQLIVRGLGDRYSITTLNGQPIASPNPDNKLIPLDIFPASTVRNITVSKV